MKIKMKGIGAIVLSAMLCSFSINIHAENQIDYQEIQSKLRLLEMTVEDNYLYDKNAVDIENETYKGFIRGLGDRYSHYLTKNEYDTMLLQRENKYNVIGVTIEFDAQYRVVINDVTQGLPAEKAGLKKGDIIHGINGTLVKHIDNFTLNYINTLDGKTVTLDIISKDSDKVKTLEIEKVEVVTKTVLYKMMSKEIGYVYITEFTSKTYSEFVAAIDSLEKDGMKKLILDIRDNPGGDLLSTIQILAYILPDKELLYVEDKNQQKINYYTKDGLILEGIVNSKNNEDKFVIDEDNHQLTVPIAVLVSEYSASASEILAGCLKDYKRATIIGEQTYGKGIVQKAIEFDDGSALLITVSEYFLPSGTSIHNIGVAPDIKMKYAINDKKVDVQLEKAIEILEEK